MEKEYCLYKEGQIEKFIWETESGYGIKILSFTKENPDKEIICINNLKRFDGSWQATLYYGIKQLS